MAATRHTLQREIFNVSDEKILSICRVSKAYKKKKTSFLCLISTVHTPETFILYQVKQSSDKSVFKKKQSWLFSDIHTVDGISNDSMDLELHIDKIYKWSTTNLQERRNFINGLYTISFGLPQRPEFINIPKHFLTSESSSVVLNDNCTTGYNSGKYIITHFFRVCTYNSIVKGIAGEFRSVLPCTFYYSIHNEQFF